jgi:hypothetical protein
MARVALRVLRLERLGVVPVARQVLVGAVRQEHDLGVGLEGHRVEQARLGSDHQVRLLRERERVT